MRNRGERFFRVWRRAGPRLLVLVTLINPFTLINEAISTPAWAQTGGSLDWHSGWTVLEYDSKGGVIGTRRGGGPDAGGTGTGTAQPPASAPPAHEKHVESGEVLVANPPAGVEAILTRLGFVAVERVMLDALSMEMLRVRTPAGMPLPAAIERLREAMPEAVIDTNDLLDLSRGADGRSMGRVQLAQARQDYAREATGWGPVPESCGKGLVLGQIDGRVETRHAALVDRDILYKNLIKPGRVEAAVDHGTAIAVMLVGKPRPGRSGGLLPGAKLFAANIFERWKGRDKGNLAAMIRAVDWLVGNRVQVANLSVAGGDNTLMRLVIGRARAKGLMLVAAAGNKGPGAPPAWPAAAPESLAVTAIDRGLQPYAHANSGDYIDFAAPGVDVLTETPTGLLEQSGTSMATPFITAMVALHLDAGFEADPDKIRGSLARYSHDLGEDGRDSIFGWGLVRLRPSCR